jgi:hypothetical protein
MISVRHAKKKKLRKQRETNEKHGHENEICCSASIATLLANHPCIPVSLPEFSAQGDDARRDAGQLGYFHLSIVIRTHARRSTGM